MYDIRSDDGKTMLQRVAGDPKVVSSNQLSRLPQPTRYTTIYRCGFAGNFENRRTGNVARQQRIIRRRETFGKLTENDRTTEKDRARMFQEKRVRRASATFLLQIDEERRVETDVQLQALSGGVSSFCACSSRRISFGGR